MSKGLYIAILLMASAAQQVFQRYARSSESLELYFPKRQNHCGDPIRREVGGQKSCQIAD